MRIRIIALFVIGLLIVACGPSAPAETGEGSEALPTSASEAAVLLPTAIPETTLLVEEDEPEPVVANAADKDAQPVEADGAENAEVVDGEEEVIAKDSAEFPASRPDAAADLDTIELYKESITVGFTTDGHPFIGDLDNAPVVIEEYSDFQCPFCQRFHAQAYLQLLQNEIAEGDAALIFYDFPLSIHKEAEPAASAARCAGAQGAAAYWEMHDQLFENFGNWSVADPSGQFNSYARAIDLDLAAFDSCYAGNEMADSVQASFRLGQQRGIRGTPGFIINGELISGAQPYSVFTQAIGRAASGETVVEAPPAINPEDIEVDVPEPFELSANFGGAIGDPNAPITIVEYSDFQCPFCQRHSLQTMDEIKREYIDTGRVYYIMKDLPLDQIHPLARDAAAAARCVGQQDAEKYIDMHDLLFSQQEDWGNSADLRATFISYVTSLALDTALFETCYDNDEVRADIQQNVDEASAIGIGGTPFFFVEGFPVINGAQSIDVFNQVIELAESDGLVDAIMESQRRQIAAQQAEQAQTQPQAPAAPTGPVDVPLGDAFTIGDPDAPITIVEYTDYQCPFCQRHHDETYSKIVTQYVEQGLVRYVFKDFPLNFHPQAEIAAVAARCAGEQGSFVEMHTALFDSQSTWSGDTNAEASFQSLAAEIGLDAEPFSACQLREDVLAAVRSDLEEGSSLGVRGTPAFFINGNFISGAQPFAVFQQAIEAELSQ